jgi:hypothetical protein
MKEILLSDGNGPEIIVRLRRPLSIRRGDVNNLRFGD